MSDAILLPTEISISDWVEQARANPDQYRDRQVTEIVLTAIGLRPSLKDALVLKGGTLMALAFKSDRTTGDVDFSAQVPPDDFEETLVREMNIALPDAIRELNYLGLACRVQGVEKKPRPENFENHDFPALVVRVGSARVGTPQERALSEGRAVKVLQLEISFRDQVYAFQELHLIGAGVAINGFDVNELVAEKFRALLQQPIRKRNRRQDIYDIAYLLETSAELDASIILETLKKKCETRSITPTRDSIRDPEVKDRASRDWGTLATEVRDLPEFDPTFERVATYYQALPW